MPGIKNRLIHDHRIFSLFGTMTVASIGLGILPQILFTKNNLEILLDFYMPSEKLG
jgi:hypothetical protein